MSKLKLTAPWVELYYQLDALFKHDREVRVVQEDGSYDVNLYVDNPAKADALAHILPSEKVFGNITSKITVIPADEETDYLTYVRAAFNGNPALAYTKEIQTPFGPAKYIVFKPEVVQYYNDNMQDIYGNKSTLYEDIAKDVFEPGMAFICTDKVITF